jgi:hypothetical protein
MSPEKLNEIAEKWTHETSGQYNDLSVWMKHNILSAITEATAPLEREIERLKDCLEPGKASAIVNGMFREAERMGFYKPTYKHALTQFVEHVEQLQHRLDEAQRACAEKDEALSIIRYTALTMCDADKDSILHIEALVRIKTLCNRVISSTSGTDYIHKSK